MRTGADKFAKADAFAHHAGAFGVLRPPLAKPPRGNFRKKTGPWPVRAAKKRGDRLLLEGHSGTAHRTKTHPTEP